MTMPFDAEQPVVHSIVFGERMVEITYAEPREQGKFVFMTRQIAVDITEIEDEFAELMDSVRSVVDAGLLLQRNPERTRSPR